MQQDTSYSGHHRGAQLVSGIYCSKAVWKRALALPEAVCCCKAASSSVQSLSLSRQIVRHRLCFLLHFHTTWTTFPMVFPNMLIFWQSPCITTTPRPVLGCLMALCLAPTSGVVPLQYAPKLTKSCGEPRSDASSICPSSCTLMPLCSIRLVVRGVMRTWCSDGVKEQWQVGA